MNNDFLLSLVGAAIPVLAISFVGALLVYKVYVKIRAKFNTTVNCWFCNGFASVPYLEANCWTCPHCEQYNGFAKDGGYNREMVQQLDCSNGSTHSDSFGRQAMMPPPNNGFCMVCNEAQRLKVEKLGQFEPKNEAHFDAELKAYTAQLEEQYRLCDTCDRHLKRVLREKKKMVLGSQFLDFIIRGAETLKQPHFNRLRRATQQHWKRRLTLLTAGLAVLQLCCLHGALPSLTREHLTGVLGHAIGGPCFVALSHVLALGRVFAAYWDACGEYEAVAKTALFCRTVFMMVLYSLGLKLPQIARINFASLYVVACPFALLVAAFAYCGVDRFKLTRYTFLLVLWSAFAGGLVGEGLFLAPQLLMWLASLLTLLCAATNHAETSPNLHDTSSSSFHKMYSEDYLSDDDTVSLLSQQLNSSSPCSSSLSSASRSFATAGLQQPMNRFVKTPLTSSMHSLGQPHSFCHDDNHAFGRPQYATHVSKFGGGPMPRSGLFTSSQNLASHDRPLSSVFGASANGMDVANASFTTARSQFASPYPPPYPLHEQQRSDGSLLYAGGGSQFRVPNGAASPALLTPFSGSSNALYQSQQASGLLSPSRFGTLGFGGDAPTTSWLSGGYFNQRQQAAAPPGTVLRGVYPHEHRANGMTAIDENLSRASSQSSGFESQNGRLNASHENLLGSDAFDNGAAAAAPLGFKPIESQCGGDFSPRPSLLPYPPSSAQGLLQPLSVHCAHPPSEEWKAPSLRRAVNGRDSFNLRKINEELPRLQRGELLKKWKESQAAA